MQFDSLGMEKNHFETGITDPESLNGTEKLRDYWDDKDDGVPTSPRPHLSKARLGTTADRCTGSNSPANGDQRYGRGINVVCSVCHLVVHTYMRRAGAFKSAHLPRA
jgi:hypothetical protein